MTSFAFPRPRILAAAASILFLPTLATAQQQQPPAAPAAPPDPAQQGTDLFNANKFAEAAAAFEQYIKDNPNSPVIADVRYRLALSYLRAQSYDKAIDILKVVLATPADKIPPQVLEAASALMGEALRAKAGAMKSDDPGRPAAFEAAMKYFDEFVVKYPQSQDLEIAMFQRAISAFYTKDYSLAVPKLQEYLQRFGNSDQAQDVQFLLAIALSSQAADILRAKPDEAKKKEALDKLVQAETILQAIINRKSDLALINDALFQLGETYYLHAQASGANDKPALLQKAREAFGKVQPKEPLIKAQQARLVWLQNELIRAGGMPPGDQRNKTIKRIQDLTEREKQKLADLEQKAPPTVAAQIRMGEILFQDKKYDEVRVLFNYLKNIATTEDEKKSMAYHVAMSYPMQALEGKGETGPNGLAARAVKNYEEFKTKYIDAKEKANPTTDNLPVIVGMMFMTEPNKDYDQAIKFLKEAITLYPNNRHLDQAMLQISEAYRLKGQANEAIKMIEEMLKSNPEPNLVRSASLSLAMLLKDLAAKEKDPAKLDQAIEKLRAVIKDYPESSEAATAKGILVEIYLTKDPATAAKEAVEYAEKYPTGEQTPLILSMGARALATIKDTEGSVKLYRQIIDKYPDSEEAGAAYFSIAGVASRANKSEELIAILDEFIQKRPNDPRIADAYFSTARAMEKIKTPEGGDPMVQAQKAIDRFMEFQQKYPDNARAPEALVAIIGIREKIAGKLFSGLSDPAKKALWEAQGKEIILQAETLIEKYPDSNEVASALSAILAFQKKRIIAQQMKTEDVVAYFEQLRDKLGGNAQLYSKISFALAGYLMPIDPLKAVAIMKSAYKENLKYSPDDMELYARVLMKGGQPDEAAKVYLKLAKDYEGDKSPAGKEATMIVIVGEAKIAFAKGDGAATDAAIKKFQELNAKNQQRTPRHGEIDLILLERAYKDGTLEEVIKLAGQINNDKYAPPEVKARALFLAAEKYEKAGKIKEAADNFRKIPAFYGNVEDIASEALYRAGGLLEKIAADEKDPEVKKQIIQAIKKAYQLILSNYGSTRWADLAQERLRQIKE